MENSNQPAFHLRDVSELSAKGKLDGKEPGCTTVGTEQCSRGSAVARGMVMWSGGWCCGQGDAVWFSPDPAGCTGVPLL